jgi:hypothetical protein
MQQPPAAAGTSICFLCSHLTPAAAAAASLIHTHTHRAWLTSCRR